MNSDLEVWIARLPKFELGRDGSDLDTAVFDHLQPNSFAVHPECAAVLLRDIGTVEKHTAGRVSAQVLRANPALSWPQPPWRRRTEGTRISLLVCGTAWFDIDGAGEESFSANDSWCVPEGVDHVLLEASSDFELLEIEFRAMAGDPATTPAVPDLLMLYGTYSYRSVPVLGGSAAGCHDQLDRPDAGTALSLNLHDHPPTGWAGCPWHLHDEGVQCGYLTTGSAQIEVDRIGVVEAQAGTFWMQQARVPISRSR